jgi:peptidoglycan/LPS O-acetylase OafA/YrhL
MANLLHTPSASIQTSNILSPTMSKHSRDLMSAEEDLHELEAMLGNHGSQPQVRRSWSMPFASAVTQSAFLEKDKKPPKNELHRTAYLDGLRGFAALLVFSLHHQVWGHSSTGGEFILENAFGWNGTYRFVCFPGVRILFSGGHLAVAIFFVISGYVLSVKPLTMLQAGDTTRMSENLGSALFRRWLRLYIPVAGTTFAWMTSWHLFDIRSGNPIAEQPESTYLGEIWKWYCNFKNYSFVFDGEPTNLYNDHTWSIPKEFRGSIVVYTSLLAFAACSRNSRLLCELVLLYYFVYIVDGWYCALFVAGMLLCDLDLLASRGQLPQKLYDLKKHKTRIAYLAFAIALYLGGVPSITEDLKHLRESPGWYYLSFLKPQAFWDFRWFFRFWAAIFIVASAPHIAWLKGFFETSFCQYLGRVSFGFYLVHGPVLWTLGDRLYAASGRIREGHIGIIPDWINLMPLPGVGPFGLEINYLVPQFISLAFTLWLAEIVTRCLDKPSLYISQSLYRKVITQSESLGSHCSWKREIKD